MRGQRLQPLTPGPQLLLCGVQPPCSWPSVSPGFTAPPDGEEIADPPQSSRDISIFSFDFEVQDTTELKTLRSVNSNNPLGTVTMGWMDGSGGQGRAVRLTHCAGCSSCFVRAGRGSAHMTGVSTACSEAVCLG